MNDTKRLKANEAVERESITLSQPLEDMPDCELYGWLSWLGYRWDGEDWR